MIIKWCVCWSEIVHIVPDNENVDKNIDVSNSDTSSDEENYCIENDDELIKKEVILQYSFRWHL